MIAWRPESASVALVGVCDAEDASPLVELLLEYREAAIDLRECERAHTSIVQLVLAARRPVAGPAGDAFLRRWVEPHLPAR